MSGEKIHENAMPDIVGIVTDDIANAPARVQQELKEHAKVLNRVAANALLGEARDEGLVDLIQSLGNILEQLISLSLRNSQARLYLT